MFRTIQLESGRILAIWLASLILAASVAATSSLPAAAIEPTVNISNNDGQSLDPVIATSGSNIYIAWVDDTSGSSDLVFTMSQDGGESFVTQTIFDDGGGNSLSPSVAASGPNVYITWRVDTDIYFVSSDDSGSTFGTPVNLSENPTSSNNPRVAASGSNVYVAWIDGSTTTADVYLVASNNSGSAFSSQLILDDGGGKSSDLRITAEDTNAYVTWKNLVSGNNEVYFSSSADSGTTFSAPVNLSSTIGSSTTPAVAVAGTSVYVAWAETTGSESAILVASSDDSGTTFGSPASLNVDNLPAGLPSITATGTEVYAAWEVFVDVENDVKDVYFSASNDNGDTFGAPINLSSNAGQSSGASVAVSSGGIYVVWIDNFVDSINNEILATFSSDGGQDFVAPINLSNSPGNTFNPRLAIVDGQNAVVVMYEVPDESTPAEIHFQSNVDFAQAVISIDELINPNPRWDIDAVEVSGTMSNAKEGDTVTIDWGDGNITSGLNHTGSSWGPFYHPYSSESIAINPVQIVAHLIDSAEAVKASSEAESVVIQLHLAALELDSITPVAPGTNVTISGSLFDADESQPISGAPVTLNGSGVADIQIPSAITEADGSFSITGPSPDSIADDWTVQAHFDGAQEYEASASEISTYATIGADAVEYQVAAGQEVTVEVTNLSFNATIKFENVLQDGSIFVSECTASPSERYVAMDICAEISSALLINESSGFTISVSYDGHEVPAGFDADDVDIFHQPALGEVTDITHSRDTGASIVSGVASSFSKFIVGAAVHSEEPQGAYRQQQFVGVDSSANSVAFRDIANNENTTAQIFLDKNSYKIGETAILTIIDPEGNVDSSKIDIVTAGIESETSRENIPIGEAIGVIITLQETNASSGEFTGTFTLISGLSSGSSLQAKSGDKLTVAYNIPGRALVTIDEISESGLLQVSDYLVPQTADFVPFGGAIKVEPIDLQLSPGARVRVTLSYANADLEGNNPEFLKLVQGTSEGVWKDITEEDAQGTVIGVDTNAKTITGETGSLGSFSIGGDVGIIGGAGGGLARPGTGLVVDFVASVASSSTRGGGGGGGSSGSASGLISKQVSEGSDTESSFTVGANASVMVEFQNVTSGGSIYLDELEISDLPSGSFEATTLTQGTVEIQGSEAETVSKIFDLTYSSGFGYEPPITVTLPYDGALVNATGLSEQDVRLLHFVDGDWEDTTISINTISNTVSGKLNSLSPVTAAVVSDGTFGAAYFNENPLAKVSEVSAEVARDLSEIRVDLKNAQRIEQEFTIITQILDKDGVVIAIGWTSGILSDAESNSYTVDSGFPETPANGEYDVQVFVIDDIESSSPEMLSPQLRIGNDLLQ